MAGKPEDLLSTYLERVMYIPCKPNENNRHGAFAGSSPAEGGLPLVTGMFLLFCLPLH